MNLKQALYIQTIAREGNITAAAKKLYVSQPSLSQMVRQVESEYGVTLFDRTVSPLRLTYAGEKYLQAAKTMLAANERLENELREIRQENSGLLRLGISVQRAIQILPVALPWFTMQYPKVSIDLREEGSARLEQLLEDGEIDLALAAIESVSPSLSYALIEKEVVGVLAGKGAAIAQQLPPGTPISLSMIREDAFVSLKPGHSVRVVQDALFHESGMKPQILLETDSLEVAKRVAVQAGACMLCSDIFVDDYARRGGVFYPLMDYENKRHLYACWRKGEKLPRYAEGFIQIVSRILDKNAARL
ncbi:MAG: LysR family transcriptional regulator [Oscillospiraceae bacterium]|nr:LysR family transcriptional regulator [Oscillospiraceae bacterium]